MPVVELSTRALHGFELAAATGPAERVLETGVRAAASWAPAAADGPAIVVDLGPADLHARTVARILALLGIHALRAEALTVRVPSYSPSVPCTALELLVDRGVAVQVCDVDWRGAHHRLAGAPIDVLELPAALVDASDQSPNAVHGLARLIDTAHTHDWLTMARGVARAGQLEALDRLGCDLASGPVIGAELARVDADRVVARYFPRAAAAAIA